MNKPEILAPCGEFNSVIYAINAGADAVYLGGEMFSARAYASNLNTEEIIEAIKYAHLHNAKVYLTLNTLLKNKEIKAAIDMIRPLYENGLDAIIIQDFGLLLIINKMFPSLEIHASTQMSIMSSLGVEFLKDFHVTRVVPSRELSIKEIAKIKEVGLEIECFVHGAMCYSYSGKCLFSSIAGGRSGNRGRCAGPCRKSYDICTKSGKTIKKNCYPLSMKDMCTINNIDALIDAEVDSFKIEGRMKAPEYSAGVSNLYKKYTDKYLEEKNNRKVNNISINVDKKDIELLKNLYIRGDIQEGYLKKHNGADMISVEAPGYNSVSKELISKLKSTYENRIKVPVCLEISIFKEQNMWGKISMGESEYELLGEIVLPATNKPIDEATIKKQLCKLGNTNYACEDITIYTDEESFVSISSLNEFRRQLIEGLEKNIFKQRDDMKSLSSMSSHFSNLINEKSTEKITDIEEKYNNTNFTKLVIGINSFEQLLACQKFELTKDYIFDLFSELFDTEKFDKYIFKDNEKIYIRIPAIIREKNLTLIRNRLASIIDKYDIAGVYVNSIDGLMLAREYFDKDKCFGDIGIYVFNDYANYFFANYLNEYTVSVEHNEKELSHYSDLSRRQILIYGYIPLMYSANCIVKTCNGCDKKCDGLVIRDEGKRSYYSKCNHELCFNTIYNNVPLKLFKEINKLISNNYSAFRIEFTIENTEDVYNVLNEYISLSENKKEINDIRNNNYTLGHYKRGVE